MPSKAGGWFQGRKLPEKGRFSPTGYFLVSGECSMLRQEGLASDYQLLFPRRFAVLLVGILCLVPSLVPEIGAPETHSGSLVESRLFNRLSVRLSPTQISTTCTQGNLPDQFSTLEQVGKAIRISY